LAQIVEEAIEPYFHAGLESRLEDAEIEANEIAEAE